MDTAATITHIIYFYHSTYAAFLFLFRTQIPAIVHIIPTPNSSSTSDTVNSDFIKTGSIFSICSGYFIAIADIRLLKKCRNIPM